MELATALMQQRQQQEGPPRYNGHRDERYVRGSEYDDHTLLARARAYASDIEHAEYAYEGTMNHTIDHHADEDEDDDDYEPPHGNGGYYDFGYSREEEDNDITEEQVVVDDRRHTPAAGVADNFSPSAGVFHRHTLPFNLPNMGDVQLQRRTSSNSSNNNNNTNVTVSSATY